MRTVLIGVLPAALVSELELQVLVGLFVGGSVFNHSALFIGGYFNLDVVTHAVLCSSSCSMS